MLGCHSRCWSVETPKNYSSTELPSAHVVQFGCAIDDMIDCLESKVYGHELDDGGKPHEGSPATDSSEAAFGDGGVPESLRSMLVDESLGDFVGPVIVGDFLPNDEDIGVSVEFLVEGTVESLSVGDFGEVPEERGC